MTNFQKSKNTAVRPARRTVKMVMVSDPAGELGPRGFIDDGSWDESLVIYRYEVDAKGRIV